MNNNSHPRCGSAACVDVARTDGGVVLTSTLGADRGEVRYDDTEWTAFVTQVKSGAWDHTVADLVA